MKKIFIIILTLVSSRLADAQHPLAKTSGRGQKGTGNKGYILNANHDAVKWKDTAY
jgi:hypothetical protein